MKKLVLSSVLLVLLSSCQSYLLSTVSSSNTQKADDKGFFKVENDSLIITYNFAGNNSPINIEVYNKLNEPLYINWKKSALIVADKAYSYVDDKITINGTASTVSTQFYKGGDTYTDGTIAAVGKIAKDESFIPPHAGTGRSIYILNNISMPEIEKNNFKKKRLTYLDGSGEIFGKSADFTPENSPLKFKSYLTLYTLKDNQPKEFSSQQDFFVSNVTKAMSDAHEFYQYSNQPGNVIVRY